MKKAVAVNLCSEPNYDIYMGRAGRGQDGYFGNPIKIGRPCLICGSTHGRGGSIQCFKTWFRDRIENDETYKSRLQAIAEQARLKGRPMKCACFCKPAACHVDVIVEYLNSLEEE